MDNLKTTMHKKQEVDTKRAIQKAQTAQKQVNSKVYTAMSQQMPTKIRAVIKDAITKFQDGNVSKADVSHLLSKSFSPKFFQDVLLCVQGDLNKCKKINLEKWSGSAKKVIDDISKKGKAEKDKEKAAHDAKQKAKI